MRAPGYAEFQGKGAMPMAKDTKQRLADSLKSLLSEKTLDHITVKEIVAQCGINRQTFYYNFQDVYALLDWIFQQEIARLHISDPGCPWKEGFCRTVQYLRDNQKLILNAYHSVGRIRLERYLTDTLLPIMQRQTTANAQGLTITPQEREFVAQLHTSAFLGILFSWMDRGMPDETPISLQKVALLIDGSMQSMLNQIAEPQVSP